MDLAEIPKGERGKGVTNSKKNFNISTWDPEPCVSQSKCEVKKKKRTNQNEMSGLGERRDSGIQWGQGAGRGRLTL